MDMPTLPVARPRSLLDAVLAATPAERAAADGLAEFLRERSPWASLAWWMRRSGRADHRLTRREVVARLTRDIARLDALLTRQVNAILHHPAFQQLEASWRGLHDLVGRAADAENVKVRLLHLAWRELVRDQERAIEFDQSQLFRKVYSNEFGTPGGEPFGLLLGDYEVRHRPDREHPTDDVGTLAGIAGVAAAAFAPFVAAADPALLDLPGFADLERPLNLGQTFAHADYLKWQALRQAEDARFVGVVLPRVLRRVPYADLPARPGGFRFREDVGGPGRENYLWGTAVYAFGAVVVQAFADSGWFAELRGVRPGLRGRGLVAGLPVHCFPTDREGVAPNSSTDAQLTEHRDKELAQLGFVPLCHCPGTDVAAFFSNMSLQRPATYDRAAATANAGMSAMLQYVLCVSRFAHYLKVIARDRIGSFEDSAACEDYLRRWLINYTTANPAPDDEERARYPLRDAQVQVRESAGKPGSFRCVMHLCPHVQLDQVIATVRLATELTQARR
jgi:type VI secretion system protein ImpD